MYKLIKNRIPVLSTGILIAFTTVVIAQQKTEKLSREYSTAQDVNILIDAQNTNIIFENWNKDKVSITATMETQGLDDVQIEELRENWQVNVEGNNTTVRINSTGNAGNALALQNLSAGRLDDIVSSSIAMLKPMMNSMVAPGMADQQKAKKNNSSYTNIDEVKFDYEAYEQYGEAYLKDYKEKIRSKFGENFENIIAQWQAGRSKALKNMSKEAMESLPSSPFGNLNFNLDAYNKDKQGYIAIVNSNLDTNVSIPEVDDWLASLEQWKADFGENFSNNIQDWQEEYAAAIQKDMKVISKSLNTGMSRQTTSANNAEGRFSQTLTRDARGNIIGTQMSFSTHMPLPGGNTAQVARTLVIQMPENARLNLDIRRGNVEVGEAKNAQIKLAYGALLAKKISGDHTFLAIAYSPVDVEHWNYGTLQTNYVKRCVINKAEDIRIDSRASNVVIKEIENSAVIRGRFGELSLQKLSGNFKTLNISLENSELSLDLPEEAYSLTYNGTRSLLNYPNTIEARIMRGYDSQMLNGFYKSENSGRNISISSKFSDISLN